MNNLFNKKTILFIIMLMLSGGIISAQDNSAILSTGDSLSLKDIISKVISNYPLVKVAEEAVNNGDSKIGMAKSSYNPVVDLVGNFSNLGPVTRLSIPEFGSFQLYPAFNYSASLNYQQLLYDFGRSRKNVEFENENKEISKQTVEQVKQKMSVLAVTNFYNLVFLQAAIKIKDEQIAALNEHLQYVQKMMSTGSATEYQVLTTKVRISAVESQKVDLTAALETQRASLNSLMGNDQSAQPRVKNELSFELPVIQADSLFSYALQNRDEVLINQRRSASAELRYGLTKLSNRPVLSFIAQGGAKNGYIPDLAKFTPNYVLGMGIRIPILDGMKTKYNLAQAHSAIVSLSYESDYTRRTISNEVSEALALMNAAGRKINQFRLQYEQAIKAYGLAETSFKSGVITNLDLLDANTSVSESSLLLLKAKIDYAASVYRLKAALGKRIY